MSSTSWTSQGDLFVPGGGAVGPAVRPESIGAVAKRLDRKIRLGTSSWSFPGWSGLVWDRSASATTLSRFGLEAYAQHPLLRTVGVDRSWYGPVERATWRRWSSQVPEDFRFVIKADRLLTTPGEEYFLDPNEALRRIEPIASELGSKLGVVILQFPPFDPEQVGGPRRFAERLYRGLDRLRDLAGISVEIRSGPLLTEDYVAALHHGGATHVHLLHPQAPDWDTQCSLAAPVRDPLVVRWMLRPGMTYEGARDLYSPFRSLQAEDLESRHAIAHAIGDRLDSLVEAFVIVNNKAEGSSPLSIERLAEVITAESS